MDTTMTHTHVVAAAPDVVYRLVADVTLWPVVFGPTVHVKHLHRAPGEERFQLWALVNGEVKNWVSRRTLDAEGGRITFQQERGHAPIASMGGMWSFRPLDRGRTEVVLDHTFAVTDVALLEGIAAAVDHNSTDELAALGRMTELGHPVEELIDTFSDTVVLEGSLQDAYEFVHRSDLWPSRLPHVGRVDLTEDSQGVQSMEMDTVTSDGGSHTTRSIRVCETNRSIAYKQLLPPAMLVGHSGEWTFTTDGPRVEVTAAHTVAIDPAAARRVLGEDSTVAQARVYLREALGGNGRATLTHAGEYTRAGKARTAP